MHDIILKLSNLIYKNGLIYILTYMKVKNNKMLFNIEWIHRECLNANKRESSNFCDVRHFVIKYYLCYKML